MDFIGQIELVVTILFVLAGVIGFFGSKWRHKNLENDPIYQKRLKEREIELQRQAEQEMMLENAMTNDTDYN